MSRQHKSGLRCDLALVNLNHRLGGRYLLFTSNPNQILTGVHRSEFQQVSGYMLVLEHGTSVVECHNLNREAWVRIPFAALSKLFLSLHDAPVHSAVKMSTWL